MFTLLQISASGEAVYEGVFGRRSVGEIGCEQGRTEGEAEGRKKEQKRTGRSAQAFAGFYKRNI